MVIFKRKTQPKEMFPLGIVVHHHPKGWMDVDGIKLWIQKVWRSQPGGMVGTRSLLVWDSFQVHLIDPVKRALHRNNTESTVIPGGLTSVIQLLDVCLNKPFKDWLREKWTTWMVEGEKALTAGGKVKEASLETVACWVLEAWRDLPGDMVSISNAIDGTEDDLLLEEEEDCIPEEDNENKDEDLYDNQLTEEEWQNLLGESDDKDEFDGF